MRNTVLTVLILAACISTASAQADGTRQLTEGQRWVVQQERIALASDFRLAAMSQQLAQERQNRAIRQLPAGRPQRQMR